MLLRAIAAAIIFFAIAARFIILPLFLFFAFIDYYYCTRVDC